MQRKYKHILSIDISTAGVHVVAAMHRRGGYRVLGFSSLAYDTGRDEAVTLRRAVAKVSQHLRPGSVELKSGQPPNAIATIPNASAIVKNMEFDSALKPNDIRKYLHARAKQLFDQPADRLVIDFERVGRSLSGGIQMRVAAVPRRFIQERIHFFRKAQLQVCMMDVGAEQGAFQACCDLVRRYYRD